MDPQDVSKAASTLKQLVRDWSVEGAEEREGAYAPILEAVLAAYPDEDGRSSVRVCVPGCGLGRLAWEFAAAGFAAQGNEFSYFMLLTSNWILNSGLGVGDVLVYPNATTTTNLRSRADQFAPVRVPDVAPGSLPEGADFSMVAGDFVEVYGAESNRGTWDVVATCFFVDTARNICDYIETIYHMLPENGLWVNLGPLLYHFADMAGYMSVELAWDELKALIESGGFVFEVVREVESRYAGGLGRSLLQTVYTNIFFVARRCPTTTSERTSGASA